MKLIYNHNCKNCQWHCPVRLFHHLRARGIGVYVWVLNSEAEYEKAFRSGVSGVMTDYPAKLRSFLDANPALHTCADEQ